MRNDLDIFKQRFLNPFAWKQLQKDVGRLFDDDFRNMDSSDLSLLSPRCDIEEADDHYLISVEMPGVSKDNVKVEISNNILTVSGEKKEEKEKRTKTRYLSERTEGSYYRSLTLPANIDADKVEATHGNGVLSISIPKTQRTDTRNVKVL